MNFGANRLPRKCPIAVLAGAVFACFWFGGSDCWAQTRLRNICRVKGQEENTLQGLGMVVGLNGTGEAGDGPTMRSIARAMELLGSPVNGAGQYDPRALDELKKMKNMALVTVTATVPATGARRGDKLDCSVAALNGKSLLGGQVMFTALKGPSPSDPKVYALCNGQVQIEDASIPTSGRVYGGCRLEQDIYTKFELDGYVTLVLDRNHAGFNTAEIVTSKLRRELADYYSDQSTETPDEVTEAAYTTEAEFVIAVDASNIRVQIPDNLRHDPIPFIALLLDLEVNQEESEARVVINPRTGSIVISGDVRIGDVVVVHKNAIVEAGAGSEYTPLYSDTNMSPSLQSLVDQLERLKTPPEDVIEIIRGIDRNGKLLGKLIIE